jgi:hypothetical protein
VTRLDSGAPNEGRRLRVRPFVPSYARELGLLSFVYQVVRSVLRLIVWSLSLEMLRHLRSWSYATSSRSSTVRSVAPASSPGTACCSPPPAA